MKHEEVGVEGWRAAMLREDSGRLIGLARNYLGGVKTPFDKRDLVRSLEAFLARPETGRNAAALLDGDDIRILGTIRLAGTIADPALKGLFLGEMPLAELGARLENLRDRLLVFITEGPEPRYAVNPVLLPALLPRLGDLGTLFGARGQTPSEQAAEAGSPLAMRALAIVAFIAAHPGALRKHGGISGRARLSLTRVCPDLPPGESEAILRAFARAGGADREPEGADEVPSQAPQQDMPRADSGGTKDPGILIRFVRTHWHDLPWRLALLLAGGDQVAAPVLGQLMEPFVRRGFAFGAAGLARMLRLASLRSGASLDDPNLVDAMVELGILTRVPAISPLPPDRGAGGEPAFLCMAGSMPTAGSVAGTAAGAAGTLAVEGSGILHLMPEAGLGERLFLIGTATPLRLSAVWDFELDRAGVRRAFSAGLSADDITRGLESMSGRELPQTVRFSIQSWAEEYQHLRLFRGTVMAVDAPTEEILARSGVAAELGARKLGPGIYFLGAAHHDRIEEALGKIGMDAPPFSHDLRTREPGGNLGMPDMQGMPEPIPQSGMPAAEGAPIPGIDFDLRAPSAEQPSAMAGLRDAIAALDLPQELRADLEERVSRKLVLGADQLKALSGGGPGIAGESGSRRRPAPVLRDQVAGAMDYQGKLRLVKQALKSSLDRLEVQWTDPEGTRRGASLRPVRIDQNQKGHVLEAEDLGSGGPVRISIGALSAVRLVRASYFGEEP